MCYTIILYFQDATVDFAFIYNKDMCHHILWDLFHFLWLRVTCYPIVCMFLYFIVYFSGPAESTHLNQSLEQRHDYRVFNISVITVASSTSNCLSTTYTVHADPAVCWHTASLRPARSQSHITRTYSTSQLHRQYLAQQYRVAAQELVHLPTHHQNQ